MPLPRNKEGDPDAFFEKVRGYGYNDLCALPRLSKTSSIESAQQRRRRQIITTEKAKKIKMRWGER